MNSTKNIYHNLDQANAALAMSLAPIRGARAEEPFYECSRAFNALLNGAIQNAPHVLGGVEVEFVGLDKRDSNVPRWLQAIEQDVTQPDPVREAAKEGRVIMPLPLVVVTSRASHGSGVRADAMASFESIKADWIHRSGEGLPAMSLAMEPPLFGTKHTSVPIGSVEAVRFLPFGEFNFSPALKPYGGLEDRGTPFTYYIKSVGFRPINDTTLNHLDDTAKPIVANWLTCRPGNYRQDPRPKMIILPGEESRLLTLDETISDLRDPRGMEVRTTVVDQLVHGQKNRIDEDLVNEIRDKEGLKWSTMTREEKSALLAPSRSPVHSVQTVQGKREIVEYLWRSTRQSLA
ncbi:hypothetical protein IPG41_00120 [Candidatus Peregrinibacteria bacterium]|nr:MAG: hypothetical protein IPG41_00120 [Candidatus Peregrinibacteria bacterium]